MDIIAINEAIEALENDDTTVDNVRELASLYICRENMKTGLKTMVDDVKQEYDDILPYYLKYRDTKRRYQMNEAIDSEVIQGIKDVCRELQEFIAMLYQHTDMNKERLCIKDMIRTLAKKYSD